MVYIIEFQTLAADSAWNDAAFYNAFYRGFVDSLKDVLASQTCPKSLKKAMEAATWLDSRYREQQFEKCHTYRFPAFFPRYSRPLPFCRPVTESRSPVSSPTDTGKPMQLGRSHLSPEGREEELETGLCLLCSQDTATCAKNVVWVEYVHNSLPSSATGLTPFQTVCDYQLPLFSWQAEAKVPSAAALVWRCHLAWRRALQSLLRSVPCYEKGANKHQFPAPQYSVGQKVWLSTADLPLRLESRKLAPRFVGPFPIAKVVNPVAVRLWVPKPLRVHPTFHILKIKPAPCSWLMSFWLFGNQNSEFGLWPLALRKIDSGRYYSSFCLFGCLDLF